MILYASIIVLLFVSNASTQSDSCTEVGYTCSGCSNVKVCFTNTATPYYYSCVGTLPYCNDGLCSDSPLPGCNFTSSFNCPATDGTYPDGSECTMYHMCLNGTSTDYYCNVTNTVYSPTTNSCVRKSSSNPCNTVNCKNELNKWIPYPGDKSLYFFCANDGVPLMVDKCLRNKTFNEDSQECEITCTEEGMLPNDDDPSKFYECTLETLKKYIVVERNCPNNTTFNESLLYCT